MATRCKVKCQGIEKSMGSKNENGKWIESPVYTARFSAAPSGTSPENAEFFAATPTVEMRLGTIRDDHFQVGQEYYVDFTPAGAAGA
jgi:hypothetical protein